MNAIFCIPTRNVWVLVAPHPLLHLVLLDLFNFSCSSGWDDTSLWLICISLITSDANHFMCLFAFHISLLVEYLFKSFAHLLIGFFVLLSCKNYLYILDTNLLSDTCFKSIFSQSVAYFLIFLKCLSKSIFFSFWFFFCHMFLILFIFLIEA